MAVELHRGSLKLSQSVLYARNIMTLLGWAEAETSTSQRTYMYGKVLGSAETIYMTVTCGGPALQILLPSEG